MNQDWADIVGVMVVRDQAHLVHLPLISAASVVDKFHVVDNESDDGTVEAIQETATDLGVPVKVDVRDGYAGRLFLEAMQEHMGDFVIRMEGDQAYWPEQLERLAEAAFNKVNTSATVYMLRNYLHLQNQAYPTNADHPTIYPVDGTNEMVDGKLWPRSKAHRGYFPRIGPIGVNCKVLSPEERIKRWHRARWWRWGSREVEPVFTLDGYDKPYQEHVSLEEYIWKLIGQGKGVAAAEWGGTRYDSLAEMGRDLIEWDVRKNCQYYGGDYPPVLKQLISEKGYGAGVV